MLQRGVVRPNAHSSGLTRSRCLAGETSYWLVFVFLSTFLFTSSTCLPCCGRCCAECLFSWSRRTATWPVETWTCGIPLLSLIGPSSCELMMAGDFSAVTLAQTKSPWHQFKACWVLETFVNSTRNDCCGFWAVKLCLWRRTSISSFLWRSSPPQLFTLCDYCTTSITYTTCCGMLWSTFSAGSPHRLRRFPDSLETGKCKYLLQVFRIPLRGSFDLLKSLCVRHILC